MNLVWSLPVRGESLDSTRGDLVRARALVGALRADGHRVTVVSDGVAASARARVRAYRKGIRPFVPAPVAHAARDLGRVLHARAHARRVAEVARREGARLVIETQVHFAGSGARAARLAGVPFLLDDCSPWTEERALGAGLPSLARLVLLGQARTAAALTVSSERIRERLVDGGVSPERVHVVPNGVDVGPFQAVDRARARRRLGLEHEVVIAFVGSFQPWHRADLLVDALRPRAAPTDDGGPLVRLLLIGDGPGLAEVRERARASGVADRVQIVGALDGPALAEVLSACDIGALPASNDYGQPMKLLDYAAAGLAIVAADVPPVRDMIDPGVTGLLVPAGDAAALGGAIRTLARLPVGRRRLGLAARERLAIAGDWRLRARALLATAAPAPRPLPQRRPASLALRGDIELPRSDPRSIRCRT